MHILMHGWKGLFQRADHGRTEGQVGHKMRVHDIHMQAVHAVIQHALHLGPHAQQIAGQDG